MHEHIEVGTTGFLLSCLVVVVGLRWRHNSYLKFALKSCSRYLIHSKLNFALLIFFFLVRCIFFLTSFEIIFLC